MVRACRRSQRMLLTLLLAVWGCGPDDRPRPGEADPLVFPASFQQDGTSWTLVPEMAEADVRQLSEYFRRNPSVAENWLVTGDPMVYAADRKGRRFYWCATAIEDVEWLCIEIGRGPVRLFDGRGNPFGHAAASSDQP